MSSAMYRGLKRRRIKTSSKTGAAAQTEALLVKLRAQQQAVLVGQLAQANCAANFAANSAGNLAGNLAANCCAAKA
eukprot:6207920-Pleurochrysis_carterae.AAC.2